VVADVVLRVTQIVSKSLAIKREALEAVGGWLAFKDLLAEDQRLGRQLAEKGYRSAICPTPVHNVQRSQSFGYFWGRHTRWAMIRFKVLPAVWLEPVINPLFVSVVLMLTNGEHQWAWWLMLACWLVSIVFTQATAVLARGYGFALNEVTWRGNKLRVGKNTLLSK